MRLSDEEARGRFGAARVAYLATVRRSGAPHIVPIVFALDADRLYSIADPKPKQGPDLLRFRNIAAQPKVSLLVDAYQEDWKRLWWVRIDGSAAILEEGPDREHAIELLRAKYPQYATWTTPFGAAMVVNLERWSSWALSAHP